MNASTAGLRPFLPSDTPILARIFCNSIEELASEDYGPSQIEAWTSTVADLDGFAKKLGETLTLVATIGGTPAGFASMKGTDQIDMLYVASGVARQGIATMLLNALEKLAAARGADKLSVDASDTAEPFFKARGFVGERRNTALVGDEWLGNTTMTKALAPTAPSVDTLQ